MLQILIYAGGSIAVLLTLFVLFRKFCLGKRCPACGYSDPDRIPR